MAKKITSESDFWGEYSGGTSKSDDFWLDYDTEAEKRRKKKLEVALNEKLKTSGSLKKKEIPKAPYAVQKEDKKKDTFKLPGQEIFETVGNFVKDKVVAPAVDVSKTVVKSMAAPQLNKLHQEAYSSANEVMKKINADAESGKITWDEAKKKSNAVMLALQKSGISQKTAEANKALTNLTGQVQGAGKGVIKTVSTFVPEASRSITHTLTGVAKRVGIDNEVINKIYEKSSVKNKDQVAQFVDKVTSPNKDDGEFGYELGASGTRLAIDMILGIATGGNITPALLHFSEIQNQNIDRAMENGVSFEDAWNNATASAAIQGALEKIGFDELASPFGRQLVSRIIKGMVTEGTEEAIQQIADNWFASMYDENQQLVDEDVWKSALMGGILGAGAGGTFGTNDTNIDPKTQKKIDDWKKAEGVDVKEGDEIIQQLNEQPEPTTEGIQIQQPTETGDDIIQQLNEPEQPTDLPESGDDIVRQLNETTTRSTEEITNTARQVLEESGIEPTPENIANEALIEYISVGTGDIKNINTEILKPIKGTGVDELSFDNDGYITLYRSGDVTPGIPNSFSLEKSNSQIPYKVKKDDILVNTNSKALRTLFERTFSNSSNENHLANNIDVLDTFNKVESEIIATDGVKESEYKSKAKSSDSRPEHIVKGKELSTKRTEESVRKTVIDRISGYIERNSTFEKFANDINTLGQTFGEFEGNVEFTKKEAIVKLADGRTFRYKLEDIYNNKPKKKGEVKKLGNKKTAKDVLEEYLNSHAEHSVDGLHYWLDANNYKGLKEEVSILYDIYRNGKGKPKATKTGTSLREEVFNFSSAEQLDSFVKRYGLEDKLEGMTAEEFFDSTVGERKRQAEKQSEERIKEMQKTKPQIDVQSPDYKLGGKAFEAMVTQAKKYTKESDYKKFKKWTDENGYKNVPEYYKKALFDDWSNIDRDYADKEIVKKPKSKSKPKGSVKQLSQNFKVVYPEIKELPTEVRERLPEDVRDGNKKATPSQIQNATDGMIQWGKTQLRELVKQTDIQDTKLDIIEDGVFNEYGKYKDNIRKELYISYDKNGIKFQLPLSSIGFTQKRIENSGIKVGDTILLKDVVKAKGAIPSLRDSSGTNYSIMKKPVVVKKVSDIKQKQLDVINRLNPMTDTYHTGIRSVDDIKTFREAFDDPESFADPDFSKADGQRALNSGKITIYSSKPLDKNNAQFVTPSKMEALTYSGDGKVYSKEVSIDDVAWINADQGQLVGNVKSTPQVTKTEEDYNNYSLGRISGEEIRKSRSVEDLQELANQLNKAGQILAISRRGGLKSKKAAGVFQHGSNIKGDERIKLQDAVINEPGEYVRVLAHELSHAIEFTINGTTGKTYSLFGELTKDERATIKQELKDIVNYAEGEDVVQTNPTYYNKPTEQLARYVETLLQDKSKAREIAPLVSSKFDQAVVNNPELQELMDAIDGIIDKGFKNKTPDWYRDMRQSYQKYLGKKAGDQAYNAEVIRRAEVQRWNYEVGRLIKDKFKNVKDNPELLFKAAEAIKQTDEDGNFVYGTRDFIRVTDDISTRRARNAGYEYVRSELVNNKEVKIFGKQRYTEAEGEQLFNQLSEEGQQLVKDFVARKEDAKDIFNRELIKDVYKIDANIEGWVHRGLQKKGRMTTLGGKNANLRRKIAGAKKQRSGGDNFVQDFKKQMHKALLELGDADITNRFVVEQLARISKPIAKGQEPDVGWVEVTADFRKGLRLPGEGGRDKVTFTETDEMTGMEKEITFLKPEQRYQVPANLAEHYRNIRNVPTEISMAKKITSNINKYWAINVLIHPGTVATNFVSGGLQYSAKVLNDFYTDLLTGDFTMEQTRKDVAAMVEAALPRGWSKAPDWIYGGVRSTYAGQFMDKGFGETTLQKVGDIGLAPMGAVESYWKKAIALSENVGKIDNQSLSKSMLELSKVEKEMIADINQVIDLYAYDYDNVPMWIQNWGKKGGGLVKPFIKYPYKYAKMVTNLASGAFDQTLPVQERVAKMMTLSTLMAIALGTMAWGDEEKETPTGTEKTPSFLDSRGRLYIGKVNGKELFVRTAKYPFLNLASITKAAVEGQWQEANDVIVDQIGTLGLASKAAMTMMGYSNQFEKYTDKSVNMTNQLVSLIPGFRILKDVGSIIDPINRSPKTVKEAIGSALPIFGDEKTLREWRGEPRTLKIPIEPESRSITEDENETRISERYRQDILLSLMTGVYITRIDPEEAKAQAKREARNLAEDTIRAYLLEGAVDKADKLAEEVGFTIPEGTYRYYRNKELEKYKESLE